MDWKPHSVFLFPPEINQADHQVSDGGHSPQLIVPCYSHMTMDWKRHMRESLLPWEIGQEDHKISDRDDSDQLAVTYHTQMTEV